MALETPGYKVLEKEAPFEIRSYETYIAATVMLDDVSFEQASNQGFRIVADYIFGNNTKRDKVAMTAPVIQTQVSTSEKIAMTAPVNLSQTAHNRYENSFVMPRQYTLETLPEPNNKEVALSIVQTARRATLSFRGNTSKNQVAKMNAALKAWTEKKGLGTSGNVISCQIQSAICTCVYTKK